MFIRLSCTRNQLILLAHVYIHKVGPTQLSYNMYCDIIIARGSKMAVFIWENDFQGHFYTVGGAYLNLGQTQISDI